MTPFDLKPFNAPSEIKTVSEKDHKDKILEPQEDELAKFDKALSEITSEVEDIPEPPPEMKSKSYDREKKKLLKQARAKYVHGYINRLVNLRHKYDDNKKELEKTFIFKTSLGERIGLKPKLVIKVITPYGTIKKFRKKVKGSTVQVMKGKYQVSLKAVVKEGGRPTIYYHQGNPFPIIFDSEKFPYLISAESIRQMFNTNIVNQIFAGMGMAKMMGWTFGILGGIALIIVSIFIFAPGAIETMVTDEAVAPLFLLIPMERLKKWINLKEEYHGA